MGDPGDPDSRNAEQKEAFADFKRSVHHKVIGVMLQSLIKPAQSGLALECGDRKRRVCYPGIPITSLDGQEACSVCGTKAANADHPCAKCLVHKTELHKNDKQFPARTSANMEAIYVQSQGAETRGMAKALLRKYGLHGTSVSYIVAIRYYTTEYDSNAEFLLADAKFRSIQSVCLRYTTCGRWWTLG